MWKPPPSTHRNNPPRKPLHSSNRQLQTIYWQKQLIPDPWKKLLQG